MFLDETRDESLDGVHPVQCMHDSIVEQPGLGQARLRSVAPRASQVNLPYAGGKDRVCVFFVARGRHLERRSHEPEQASVQHAFDARKKVHPQSLVSVCETERGRVLQCNRA